MNVLVTGGAGYIGSHAALYLLEAGYTVTVIDNMVRGNSFAVDELSRVSGTNEAFFFYECDIADRESVTAILREQSIESVLHFAALAYVGESVERPDRYFRNNALGTCALLNAVADVPSVSRFILSSTCSTYGEPREEEIPIRETCAQRPVNPYGSSKVAAERALEHLHAERACTGRDLAYAILRYFNVAGADSRARLGEHHDPETHLIPIALQAASGEREHITIFGSDYSTHDGTCVRDYIHVSDLVEAHVRVMESLEPAARSVRVYNLGTGRGTTVRETLDAAQRVTDRSFKMVEGARRAGDPPMLFADPSRIRDELGWVARVQSVDEMIADAWRWMNAKPGIGRGR